MITLDRAALYVYLACVAWFTVWLARGAALQAAAWVCA